MEKKYRKQILTIFFLLLETTLLTSTAQEQPVWDRFYDRYQRDRIIIDTIPSILENALNWSPTVN
ncbi:hypothetical protein SAMN05444349_11060 [Bacteroides faecichinchillae]|uniref:Uncharacterized protein n=2 Tax=Bacteroides faecichinchillae TaxID=871325 RepID=A0A1M4YCS6_9BACE|nr:hypothetical protein [Bacteroides faecichinchillae]SHF03499.1 hypothetical protein SAMN05444349_11060 [Bacteroides faecichinchillae]